MKRIEREREMHGSDTPLEARVKKAWMVIDIFKERKRERERVAQGKRDKQGKRKRNDN